MLPDNFSSWLGQRHRIRSVACMAGKISMRARGEVVLAVSERYQAAGRIEKRRILDELCTATGWHRKHAIRALSPRDRSASRHLRPRRRTYGTSIRDALIALWEASGRLCGKHDSDAAAGAGTTWPTDLGTCERALVLRASGATMTGCSPT